ncbi:MAG: hypothetical protein ETSY2_54075 [Candidatus Entotheonella gemina]|uniref:TIR domain-containing protein n=1 Tax=Candidatus Entotheonella gemina TaxID=1429439 RepID=W4L4H2_9BACT|nr:MAG: hypothetical protein ETSY2_54075 [Candidatus Entotheonella gemina]
MARIFLCHANEDKPQVESLYDRLCGRGFEPWMDKRICSLDRSGNGKSAGL